EAADERGVLLWQDVPLVGPYLRGIRRQAARQARAMVDLLGHHPSIALWCGHDAPTADPAAVPGEPTGTTADALRRLATQQLPTWNRTVLDGSVRRALEKADGSRPVVPHSGVAPTSPSSRAPTPTCRSAGWPATSATCPTSPAGCRGSCGSSPPLAQSRCPPATARGSPPPSGGRTS